MKHLWAPWRTEYINAKQSGSCFLCTAAKQRRDEVNLILYRGRKAFIILNRFPYNNGHLMIAPYRHVGALEKLTPAESHELWELLRRSVLALKAGVKPEGLNVGLNLGRVAGAGLETHIHIHVVPRWNGDTNFMPVAGQTKVISEALGQTYARLRPHLRRKKGQRIQD